MLQNLEIINGDISLEFDPLNTLYTVSVDNKVTSLEINYTCDNCTVELENNDFLYEGKNEVLLYVYWGDNIEKYTLYVTREKSDIVFFETTPDAQLEENFVLVDKYQVEYLIVICVIIIAILFKLIFFKSKT